MNMDETLSEQDIWTILKNYFANPKALMAHQLETYDEFVKFGMNQIIVQNSTVTKDLKNGQKYTVCFENVYLAKPQVIEEDRTLRGTDPQDARNRDLNYDAAIHCDITEEIYDGKTTEKKIHKRIVIGRMPIMVNSSSCVLYNLTEKQRIAKGECPCDPGGYFIIKGNEKVLVAQHRANYNQVMVHMTKNDKYNIMAEVRSMSAETGHSVLVMAMIGSDNRTLSFSLPCVKDEIPCGIVFKALGFTTDKDIINLIGIDHPKAEKYLTHIRTQSIYIKTQKEALKFIGKSSLHTISKDKEEAYAWQVVETEMFPHLGISGSIKEQACYLAHIVHKLIATHIGLRCVDDKDNYTNKRIDVAGPLMYEIFRNSFKNYVNSIKTQLDKRKQHPDILTIISRLKNITCDMHKCLATGNWSVQKNSSYMKTGVAQVLDRMTFGSVISHLRRIILPVGKEGKNTAIRQIHPSQFGFICPAECFDPSTLILTWNGYIKRADNIIVGDILIDDKGNPTRVKSTCSGFKTMYEIQHTKKNFNNYTVTDNHILTLKSTLHKKILWCKKRENFQVITLDKKELKYKYKSFSSREKVKTYCDSIVEDNIVDITIEKYLSLTKDIQNTLKMFKCDGVNWPYTKTDIDPYILGMCIGDTIPKEYLTNSRAVRLQLLAGLIDTDSYVKTNGHEIIISRDLKNSKILNDILFLCRSLGFSCHVNNNDKNCELTITGKNLCDIPTRLSQQLFPLNNREHDRRSELSSQTSFKLHRKKISPFVGWQLEGNGRFLLSDFTVTHNTPEGQKAGLVLNLALLTKVSKNIPKDLVRDELEKCKSMISVKNMDLENIKDFTRIFLNNIIVGFSSDPDDFVDEVKELRRTRHIDSTVTIAYDIVDNDIKIFCDEGRLIRPLFTVKNNSLKISHKNINMKWHKLVKKGFIQYIDTSEVESSTIAMNQSYFNRQKNDYCEIHPSMMLGVMASIIPFPDHSQSPRNCYEASMAKQALGMPLYAYRTRAYTKLHVLEYAQKPLVSTRACKLTGMNSIPSGTCMVVAIATYTGYNQEDSIIMNHNAIERGISNVTTYQTITEIEKKIDNYSYVRVCLPPKNSDGIKEGHPGYFRRKYGNYSLLDENGIIMPRVPLQRKCENKNCKVTWFRGESKRKCYKCGVRSKLSRGGGSIRVNKGDAIVGKTMITGDKSGAETLTDVSRIIQQGEEGYIDKVNIMITPNGYKLIKVVIRLMKQPQVGDKLASRAAQKGTIGKILRQEDMPFTESGICPDIIINPLCLGPDSQIRLKNHGTQKICDIVDNPTVKVRSVSPTDFAESDTGIHTPFSIKPHCQMVRVKTWSGREIICTDDHPFLVGKNQWKKASELVPNQDKLTIVHTTNTLDKKGELPNLNFDHKIYSKKLADFSLDEDNICILARLLGALETDGHLHIKNPETLTLRATFHLGEKQDVDDIIQDVITLGFRKPIPKRATTMMNGKKYQTTYTVHVEPSLSYVLYLLGAHTGRKSTCKKVFPSWIKTASPEAKRQFLCGFQGGDGSYIGTNEKTQQQQVRIRPTKLTARKVVLDSHIEYMNNISNLLAEFGIISNIGIQQSKNITSKEVVLHISVKNQNIEKYSDIIEYAYCNHKRIRSRLPIEFVRLRNRGIKLPYNKMKEFRRGNTVCMFVDSVEKIEPTAKVYDFATNSDNHSFIANSIVVHNCVPSRMTINQLIECVMGNICAIRGEEGDATPFTSHSRNIANKLVEKYSDLMEERGLNVYGWENMTNGFTGEEMKAKIFMGLTHYQRLKHMVSDKMHARARGNVTMLTRQPLEGRSRDGGLRFGEMERDSMISHGASRFLKERLYDVSDPFKIPVCDNCGIITSTRTECQKCNGTRVKMCAFPYASKLLVQELQAMQIKIMLRCS